VMVARTRTTQRGPSGVRCRLLHRRRSIA